MAHSAHTSQEEIQEHYDSPELFESKLDKLAELVRESKHFVIFTGAGISTDAGISDFRGPNGVWTLRAQGKTPTVSRSTVKAVPTVTHMAIQKLQEVGICKYLISQNCDGLHRRSGIRPEKISELHGNSNIEYCESCLCEYLRDFACKRVVPHSKDHYTGRHCLRKTREGTACNGRLMNSTIDFGQNLPEVPLQRALNHSLKSDLHLVLGSSLRVTPACNLPLATVEKEWNDQSFLKIRPGKLVVCNLQTTPLDNMCTLRINERTDKVMTGLMQRLGIPVPKFSIYRKITSQDKLRNRNSKTLH
jgi:mono-ADP-ribosyltransferase sirtuin 6